MKTHLEKAILFGLLVAANAFAKEYALVTEGKPSATIQMNPRPSAPEFRAAAELQDYMVKSVEPWTMEEVSVCQVQGSTGNRFRNGQRRRADRGNEDQGAVRSGELVYRD